MEFTKEQIADWKDYERIRQSGQWNMIADPRARAATGLARAEYLFVLSNYTELKEAVERGKSGH